MDNVRNDKITRRNIRFVVVGVLVFSAITIAALVNKLSQPRILNKYELPEYGALLLDEPQALLDFTLQDQQGERFDKQRLLGKWSIFFFGFTHCGDICPTTMSVLAKTYGELKAVEKNDFQVILVTVDPERDTPEVLRDYLLRFNSDFIGVTGVTRNLINFASQMKVPYLPKVSLPKVSLPKTSSPIKSPPSSTGQAALGTEPSIAQVQQDQPQHSANLIMINPAGELHGFIRPPLAHGGLRVVWRSLQASFSD